MQCLSVVIPNHNYDRFLGAAVDSALALDWPEVEIIVVDDGSTDTSLEVLRRFGDRIRVISQPNAGPRVACNRGFAESRGDAVMFLDSDDALEPSFAREVAAVWRPGVSKVQVQMRRVDAGGSPRGRVFPAFREAPSPEQVRHWMADTASYPTPPGSGNVYARTFLERLFPLDGRCGDATDSACLAAAPFLGDVVTVPEPLVRYRVHGRNRSSLRIDPARFTRQLERPYQRQRFAWEVSGLASGPDEPAGLVESLRRGRHLLQMRIAERRLNPGLPPIPDDGRGRLAVDAVRNVSSPGPESVVLRLATALWCLVTLLAPAPIARRLIRWRFP